jgi:hypothetical protein
MVRCDPLTVNRRPVDGNKIARTNSPGLIRNPMGSYGLFLRSYVIMGFHMGARATALRANERLGNISLERDDARNFIALPLGRRHHGQQAELVAPEVRRLAAAGLAGTRVGDFWLENPNRRHRPRRDGHQRRGGAGHGPIAWPYSARGGVIMERRRPTLPP